MLRTFFLILLLVAAVTGLLLLAVNPNKTTEPTPSATPSPAQTTLIMLDSSSATQAARSVDIKIDTGNNKVTGVQLEIAYDPDILTNVDIKPGAFFENPITLLEEINREDGRISFAFGVTPGLGGVYGAGNVATLTFRTASTSGQTRIDFLPKTLVSGEGVLQSVLKAATGLTLDL
jgi:hypothetical protein